MLAYEKRDAVRRAARGRPGRSATARIDPELSRELFIRHALVRGRLAHRPRVLPANRELLDEVEELEHRARRRDILVDDETLFEFYDARVPADVVSGRHFDAWWKQERREQPDLLDFDPAMLVQRRRRRGQRRTTSRTPGGSGELELPLTYQFEPGTAADGVTVHIPLPVLGR